MALAYAKGERQLHEPFTYSSPVAEAFDREAAFVGEAVEKVNLSQGFDGVTVKVSGWAKYTGSSSFVIEDDDKIGKGFWFKETMQPGN